jgi:ubiquinone/menaquinone biosynthesis C-methylase UbiE
MNNVDMYWSEHTVRSKLFETIDESKQYAQWRLDQYPLYDEYMGVKKEYNNQIIVDYGCGPGNDLVNFIMHSKAKKIIGIDISEKSINLAKHQTGLYKENSIPIEFIKISDDNVILPLENNSIDFIICSGVLHHTSDPIAILKEFYRILKLNKHINIMIYNRDSIFFHLNIAHIKKGGCSDNNIDEIFSKNTDGVNCPISKAYTPKDVIEMCNNIGYETEFLGGYISNRDDVVFLNRHKKNALNNPNLKDEHKEFLRSVEIINGYPFYNGKTAGIGGSYRLTKK